MMIYSLGIDIAKDECKLCLQTYQLEQQTHHVQARKTISNTPSGFRAGLRWVTRHTDGATPIRCTMEATGVYHEPMALYIHQNHPGIHLSVVLPSLANKFIASQGLRSKTDKIDAYGLALMGSERLLPAWTGIDPFWRALRVKVRTRMQLMDQRTVLRNQLHALAHSALPADIAQEALKEAIASLTTQINRLERDFRHQLQSREDLQEPINCLRSIPGVGMITIASVLAETNGFERFSSIGQVISFSGYDVVIQKSGQWEGTPKLSKQGSKYIRRAMFMPASAAIRGREGPLGNYYQRLLAKHNIKMKAHVAVQKKLLTYMYILWTRQALFDPQHIRSQQIYHNNVALPEGKATVDTSQAAA